MNEHGAFLKYDGQTPDVEYEERLPIKAQSVNQDIATTEAKKTINLFQLVTIVYFLTCGGPFGVEAAIGAGGPLLSIIGFVGVPFAWSLTQALMAAELSLMFGENGGAIVWVQKAFGDFVGFVNSYNNICASLTSLPAFIVLLIDYLRPAYDFNYWEAVALKFLFVLVVVILNCVGVDILARISIIILVIIISPFIAQIVYVLVNQDFTYFDQLDHIDSFHNIQFGLFLATLIWSYGGYDQIGALAGEVSGGRRTYILGMMIAIPLNIANYLVPVIFCFMYYGQGPNSAGWKSGEFSKIAKKIGNWLFIWLLIASVLSNFGQFSASVASSSRIIWAMGRGKGTEKKLPSFVSISWRRSDGLVSPYVSIIIVGLIAFALSFSDFDFLVQCTVVVRIPALLLEYLALIALKVNKPKMERPFQVPGGIIGACLLLVPTTCICAFLLYMDNWKATLVGAGIDCVIILCAVVYFGIRWIMSRRKQGVELRESPRQTTWQSHYTAVVPTPETPATPPPTSSLIKPSTPDIMN